MIVKLIRLSCWMTIVSLILMVWSIFDPTPIPIIFAMIVGQAIGTGAFALYLGAVYLDLRRARVLADTDRGRRK